MQEIVKANISKDSRFMTDESRLYTGLSAHFVEHSTVKHSAGEYVRLDDREIHSNTVENYFSAFKRGMRGIYRHARRSTCTATSRSSISATTPARSSAFRTTSAPASSRLVSLASVPPIDGLTTPVDTYMARKHRLRLVKRKGR